MGIVRQLVRVPHPEGPHKSALRLALVQFYDNRPAAGRALRVKADKKQAAWYPVQLQQIVRKLAVAHPEGFDQGTMYFMRYRGTGQGWLVNNAATNGGRMAGQ